MSEALDIFNSSKTVIPDIRCVLPGSGEEIFMRPYTTSEQKSILKTFESEDEILLGEAFDALLKNCVTNKGFNPDAMLSRDREYLLIKLRQESDSDTYAHRWKCEECNFYNTTDINLTKLDEDIADIDLSEKEITLEGNDSVLVLGPATRADEKNIAKHIRKYPIKKDQTSHAEILNAAYAAVIKRVKKGDRECAVDFKTAMTMFSNLHMDDRKQIEDYMEGLKEYGVDMKLGKETCKECREVSDQEMNWVSFFLK